MKKITSSKTITPRVSESTNRYFNEVRGIERLDKSEIEACVVRYKKSKNPRDLDPIVLSNLRFVISIANTYKNRGIDFNDIISEGNLGLMNAAGKFDVSKGVNFTTYAAYDVQKSIIEAITHDSRTVRLPEWVVKSLHKINHYSDMCRKTRGEEPALWEIADELGLDEEKVLNLIEAESRMCVPLEASDEDGESPIEFLPNTNADWADVDICKEEIITAVRTALTTLNEKERRIVAALFGIGGPEKSAKEIAFEEGYTADYVNQIRRKVFARLKNNSTLRELFYGVAC